MEFSQQIPYIQYSPTSCAEEDDDMAAKCLILLAQGGKLAGRKFSEMDAPTTAAVKTAGGGGYVYECKTCNRAFPSFQALGGHRASHKKPKLMDPHDTGAVKKQSPPPLLMLPLPAAQVSNSSNKLPKIHECSICGAEFSSGQALGGHMRRHRPVAVINAAVKDEAESSKDDGDNNPKAAGLLLDLNLPAPLEEEEEEEEEANANQTFEFSEKQQSIVFTTIPALVDCHY